MENIKFEKMRYNNNSKPYLFCLLGVLLSLIAGFFNLNSLNPNSVLIFVKILMIILIFLFGFLSAERLKVYDKKYSYVVFGIAGVTILRIFWYPLHIITSYALFEKNSFINDNGVREFSPGTSQETINKVEKWLGSLITHSNGNSLRLLPQSGYLRGIMVICILLGAALCFIYAAAVTYVKSTQLEHYLKNKETKN